MDVIEKPAMPAQRKVRQYSPPMNIMSACRITGVWTLEEEGSTPDLDSVPNPTTAAGSPRKSRSGREIKPTLKKNQRASRKARSEGISKRRLDQTLFDAAGKSIEPRGRPKGSKNKPKAADEGHDVQPVSETRAQSPRWNVLHDKDYLCRHEEANGSNARAEAGEGRRQSLVVKLPLPERFGDPSQPVLRQPVDTIRELGHSTAAPLEDLDYSSCEEIFGRGYQKSPTSANILSGRKSLHSDESQSTAASSFSLGLDGAFEHRSDEPPETLERSTLNKSKPPTHLSSQTRNNAAPSNESTQREHVRINEPARQPEVRTQESPFRLSPLRDTAFIERLKTAHLRKNAEVNRPSLPSPPSQEQEAIASTDGKVMTRPGATRSISALQQSKDRKIGAENEKGKENQQLHSSPTEPRMPSMRPPLAARKPDGTDSLARGRMASNQALDAREAATPWLPNPNPASSIASRPSTPRTTPSMALVVSVSPAVPRALPTIKVVGVTDPTGALKEKDLGKFHCKWRIEVSYNEREFLGPDWEGRTIWRSILGAKEWARGDLTAYKALEVGTNSHQYSASMRAELPLGIFERPSIHKSKNLEYHIPKHYRIRIEFDTSPSVPPLGLYQLSKLSTESKARVQDGRGKLNQVRLLAELDYEKSDNGLSFLDISTYLPDPEPTSSKAYTPEEIKAERKRLQKAVHDTKHPTAYKLAVEIKWPPWCREPERASFHTDDKESMFVQQDSPTAEDKAAVADTWAYSSEPRSRLSATLSRINAANERPLNTTVATRLDLNLPPMPYHRHRTTSVEPSSPRAIEPRPMSLQPETSREPGMAAITKAAEESLVARGAAAVARHNDPLGSKSAEVMDKEAPESLARDLEMLAIPADDVCSAPQSEAPSSPLRTSISASGVQIPRNTMMATVDDSPLVHGHPSPPMLQAAPPLAKHMLCVWVFAGSTSLTRDAADNDRKVTDSRSKCLIPGCMSSFPSFADLRTHLRQDVLKHDHRVVNVSHIKDGHRILVGRPQGSAPGNIWYFENEDGRMTADTEFLPASRNEETFAHPAGLPSENILRQELAQAPLQSRLSEKTGSIDHTVTPLEAGSIGNDGAPSAFLPRQSTPLQKTAHAPEDNERAPSSTPTRLSTPQIPLSVPSSTPHGGKSSSSAPQNVEKVVTCSWQMVDQQSIHTQKMTKSSRCNICKVKLPDFIRLRNHLVSADAHPDRSIKILYSKTGEDCDIWVRYPSQFHLPGTREDRLWHQAWRWLRRELSASLAPAPGSPRALFFQSTPPNVGSEGRATAEATVFGAAPAPQPHSLAVPPHESRTEPEKVLGELEVPSHSQHHTPEVGGTNETPNATEEEIIEAVGTDEDFEEHVLPPILDRLSNKERFAKISMLEAQRSRSHTPMEIAPTEPHEDMTAPEPVVANYQPPSPPASAMLTVPPTDDDCVIHDTVTRLPLRPGQTIRQYDQDDFIVTQTRADHIHSRKYLSDDDKDFMIAWDLYILADPTRRSIQSQMPATLKRFVLGNWTWLHQRRSRLLCYTKQVAAFKLAKILSPEAARDAALLLRSPYVPSAAWNRVDVDCVWTGESLRENRRNWTALWNSLRWQTERAGDVLTPAIHQTLKQFMNVASHLLLEAGRESLNQAIINMLRNMATRPEEIIGDAVKWGDLSTASYVIQLLHARATNNADGEWRNYQDAFNRRFAADGETDLDPEEIEGQMHALLMDNLHEFMTKPEWSRCHQVQLHIYSLVEQISVPFLLQQLANLGHLVGTSSPDENPVSHLLVVEPLDVKPAALPNVPTTGKRMPIPKPVSMRGMRECKCGLDVSDYNVVYCANRRRPGRKCPHPTYHRLCVDAPGSTKDGLFCSKEDWFCEECVKLGWDKSEPSSVQAEEVEMETDGEDAADADAAPEDTEMPDLDPNENQSRRAASPNPQLRKKQKLADSEEAHEAPQANTSEPVSQPTQTIAIAPTDAAKDSDENTPDDRPTGTQRDILLQQKRSAMDDVSPVRLAKRPRRDMAVESETPDAMAPSPVIDTRTPRQDFFMSPAGQATSPLQSRSARKDSGPCIKCKRTQSTKWHRKLSSSDRHEDGRVWCHKCYANDYAKLIIPGGPCFKCGEPESKGGWKHKLYGVEKVDDGKVWCHKCYANDYSEKKTVESKASGRLAAAAAVLEGTPRLRHGERTTSQMSRDENANVLPQALSGPNEEVSRFFAERASGSMGHGAPAKNQNSTTAPTYAPSPGLSAPGHAPLSLATLISELDKIKVAMKEAKVKHFDLVDEEAHPSAIAAQKLVVDGLKTRQKEVEGSIAALRA